MPDARSEQPRVKAPPDPITLGLAGFEFQDLFRPARLAKLDRAFLDQVRLVDAPLVDQLIDARADRGESLDEEAKVDLLMHMAPHVGQFVAQLFQIEAASAHLDQRALDDAPIFDSRRLFLERRVFKSVPDEATLLCMDTTGALAAYHDVVNRRLPPEAMTDDRELELGRIAVILMQQEATAKAGSAEAFPWEMESVQADLDVVGRWATILAYHPMQQAVTATWPIFFRPQRLDFEELIERQFDEPGVPTLFHGLDSHRRPRDGFDLTDRRGTRRQALSEMHYCILCHERKKDSCSHGFPEPATDRVAKTGIAVAPEPGGDSPGPRVRSPKLGQAFKKNPLGIPITGCPLGEKISEAHALKRGGHSVSALAMIMVDNPLCAGTGHRICNDCMKGCIYQKQTPVDIPMAETNILTGVLGLPWGFEIYSLLMRWNPLNLRRPVALPYNGRNVLVVGMGPAGYTLAHYLLNEGFAVVGIDGLKIEPLALRFHGDDLGNPRPIRDMREHITPLIGRTVLGFGGVSEYGITVRWDKHFLDVNYHALMRRDRFLLYDSVRFGGTLEIDDAWEIGCDHIAIATGAGRPTMLDAPGSHRRGIRAASDFLMALQGGGAYKPTSLGNLQVNLPALVIGGGLTAIDAATETSAYYLVQIERALNRHETLVAELGDVAVHAAFDPVDRADLDRWLDHGRQLRAERVAARAEGRRPDLEKLVAGWGGVSIVYRKRLQDSPAYRLNHEEVENALKEGIGFADCLSPVEFLPAPDGSVAGIRFERQASIDGRWKGTSEFLELPARSVMVAAGTHPNVSYEREHPGTFAMDGRGEFFRGHRRGTGGLDLEPVPEGAIGFFTSYQKDGHFITFYGDNHPIYAGNVVRAMASARDGFEEVTALFADEIAVLDPADQSTREKAFVEWNSRLDDLLIARVDRVTRHTPEVVELVVRAPMAARRFRPGQLFRLQNYETRAELVDGTPMAMEGLPVTGAWADPEQGLIGIIVLETGGSARLAARLRPGEPIALMGPTGNPTEIPENETVLLVGGGFGNAVIPSLARAMRARGNRVLAFAGYRHAGDLFCRESIEMAVDRVIWSTEEGPLIEPARPDDRSVAGTTVRAMSAWASGELGPVDIPLSAVTRLLTIGPNRMMAAVEAARQNGLGQHLGAGCLALGSINSPMQCMMKEICAQCLQRHIDPETGRESYVFSCFQQDQPLDRVDFDHLAERLRQNSAAETLTRLWIDRLLARRPHETAVTT
ncbi:MAG: FAD-dependent oxidoreductase [Candidatus Eisenbacteria bacterium]|nr:FAD-dependent oxidoreductase [Candidatus Eisenbacteria bacterium]